MLNKGKFFFILILLLIPSLFAKEIDENINYDLYKKYTFDLADYMPHANGVAIIYKNKDETDRDIVKVYYYSSMYKIQYCININNEYIEGYCEKVEYVEPYTVEGSKIIKIEEFSGKVQKISGLSGLTEKTLDLIYSLLVDLKQQNDC